jgi:hypothetical protein
MCRVIIEESFSFGRGISLFPGLVVVVGVDGVLGEDLAGGSGCDDGVWAVHEQDDRRVFVCSSDAEVAGSAGVADGRSTQRQSKAGI